MPDLFGEVEPYHLIALKEDPEQGFERPEDDAQDDPRSESYTPGKNDK